jgi:hypothetical protein
VAILNPDTYQDLPAEFNLSIFCVLNVLLVDQADRYL